MPPEAVRAGLRAADRATPAATGPPRSSTRRLDAAHGRRAVHPHRGDPAAAARQHRPTRRRHPGPARARHHPGLHRHPDPVRPAPRLPADAARARERATSTTYVDAESTDKGFWANMRSYMVSLLKAWWGDAATADNDFCFDYLPRLTGDHGTYETVLAHDRRRRARATSCSARTRRSARPTAGCSGSAWPTWTGWWSATSSLIETATFWKDGPEIETGELRTEDIGTEVFFLPAAAHTEKDGTFTNTQRLLQWHHKAVEPPGDARSDLWFFYHLGRRIREQLAGSTDETRPAAARPHLGLPGRRAAGRADRPRPCWPRSTAGTPTGSRCRRYTELKADGSTACGCWIYCGVLRRRRQPGGPAQAGPRAELGGAGVGLGLAGRTGGSSTTGPPPIPTASRGASARRYVWWDADAGQVDRARRPRLRRRPARRRYRPARRRHRARTRSRGDRPVHHAGRRQGLAVRPGRPGRRPAARRTTSRRSRRSPTRCTASSATRSARSSGTARTTRSSPSGARTRLRRVPVRRSPPTGSPSTTPPAG